MDIFDILKLVGGLCLFLFGMNVMGEALERRAGGSLRNLLGRLTTNKWAGLLTGLGVTAVIQSSSATTVMVVGFVNSGLMSLKQAINVIMGANIGTTVTAWILSLGGIDSSNIFVQLLKPTSFTPILALIGIIFYMFCKSSKKKDSGTIFLGFATLMVGMDTMSGAVAGLADIPQFQNIFLMFKNPILGVLAGAILTAIIQSSSASVGILQALALTGQVSYGAAIPIIMGQNIGTCATALLSSIGTNKNARRAALVHLSFNVIGTIVCLTVFSIVRIAVEPVAAMLDLPASMFGIAVAHSIFNVVCTILLLPMSGFLEKLVNKLVPDSEKKEIEAELDERLLVTPPIALEYCHKFTVEMAKEAANTLENSIKSFDELTDELEASIRESEEKTDHYEDVLGTFLVRLSGQRISEQDSVEAAKLLKMIGDFERIADHGMNLMKSAKELKEKNMRLSKDAMDDFEVIFAAVKEIVDLSVDAFVNNNLESAVRIDPLEEVIDGLKKRMKADHTARLQRGECSIEAGFVLSDLITNLERTSDHCSNIAGYIIDMAGSNINLHENQRLARIDDPEFKKLYKDYKNKYSLA